ncbi:ABC-type nitrate/sulfonate/bicarbonate transport system, periplasmic component [Rhizobium leguminosarum bv. trifolii WSM2297]|uniref:ABC-type nitrate/sulfonate/bicarbonate transport system, periplasmic component n=1 Tax=Rhizobium leguminosarum bv. trifolii WSM2297 TaxID=754762 RepID=J0WEU6_RHILT|nr:ABC transporter substrate-binding protein [Rhizobium leguminosarum]EJC83788.1 ABC-type nitrate/sulfonate/bicarbonate transport system, periplasmic component [Rhizobium leguminosarum bv. trifolii WSM2297]EJC84621.1 ABC-type nitrate/sulfonate/bicarbonate transport system, periplasmic component [Rhizobium leguminosarum bv. trifolii WSM2297]
MRIAQKNTVFSAVVSLGIGLGAAVSAQAADKVSYGTNWLAQAEHGGFYQAVADGTYAKHGLDVTIVQGGPNAANSALLISGKIDFYMGGPQGEIAAVEQGIPLVDVAAIFQKDPQVLIAHPDAGIDEFEDLAKLKTLFLGKDGYLTYFEWMKANFKGFKDEQYKPYNFSPAPFLADKGSAQQGYLTSEPYEIQKQAGFEPKVFLLADNGYSPYSTMITTTQAMIDSKPDVVQRFVDASIEGWYNYLYGDNSKANALIKKDNPEMTDGQIAYSIAKMKEYGIIESGDSLDKGIGCITDAHYKAFFTEMVGIKVFKPETDYTKAFTTKFVCKNTGVALKK